MALPLLLAEQGAGLFETKAEAALDNMSNERERERERERGEHAEEEAALTKYNIYGRETRRRRAEKIV